MLTRDAARGLSAHAYTHPDPHCCGMEYGFGISLRYILEQQA